MGHYLTFNGVNTEDYGIIISGAGTYATPERDITPIPIPGRNGDLHVDNGRFSNIQVRFEAGLSKGFESRFLPFMNAMLSAPSYSRLETDYHPDEYRLGTFMAEMVPDVGTILRSGHFDLVFDCKPQRFLKAGERTALTLSSNTTPTCLIAQGSGKDIFTNSVKEALAGNPFYNINTSELWTVIDLDSVAPSLTTDRCVKLIYPDSIIGGRLFYFASDVDPTTSAAATAQDIGYTYTYILSDNHYQIGRTSTYDYLNRRYLAFPTPINWEVWNDTTDALIEPLFSEHETIFNPTRFAATPLLHMTLSAKREGEPVVRICDDVSILLNTPATIPNTGESLTDIYIDCETMNAYTFYGEAVVPLNKYVVLPNKTITLRAGVNHIYVNGYIDSLEVIPRWWRI